MTQVIAARHHEGIVVATDSRAIRFEADGPERTFTVQKLFQLGSHAFVLSAGSGLGIPLSRRLQAFVQVRGIQEAEDILGFAGGFLNQHYRRALCERRPRSREGPPAGLYFLVGGASRGDPERTYRLIFLASEEAAPSLEQHEVGQCLTIPRSLGTEMHLHRLCQEHAPLPEILEFVQAFLIQRTQEEEGVGPPYFWGLLTLEGLRLGQWSQG